MGKTMDTSRVCACVYIGVYIAGGKDNGNYVSFPPVQKFPAIWVC